MKRAPFLGAAALLLAGCGGRNVLRALPGVATFKQSRAAESRPLRLVPESAEAIPDYILKRPIVGEAWRFDGAAAPLGWLLCRGQTLTIADNRHLFAILGTAAGGDGKTTFKLPNGRSLIIAAGGVFPATFAVFAQSGRHMSHTDSLGEGARMAPPKFTKPPSQKLLADRRLLTQSVRVDSSAPRSVSRELVGRIRAAQADGRSAVIDRLGATSRARLLSAVDATVAGRTTQYAAVTEMAAVLSEQEAYAVIEINDGITRAFQDRWAGAEHPQPRLEAAYIAVSIAFTPEQKEALAARERS